MEEKDYLNEIIEKETDKNDYATTELSNKLKKHIEDFKKEVGKDQDYMIVGVIGTGKHVDTNARQAFCVHSQMSMFTSDSFRRLISDLVGHGFYAGFES